MSDDENIKLLLKAINLRKYEKGDPKRVLLDIFLDLAHKHGYYQSWNLVVELLGHKLGLTKMKDTALFDEFDESLTAYLVAAAKHPWDHIGEIRTEYQLSNNKLGEVLTPRQITDFMTKLTLGEIPDGEQKTVLDPCTGTGRFLLSPTLMYPDANLILFAIEINLELYRAALVNMRMFSYHPYYIVCADFLRLHPDRSGVGSRMWRDCANRWDPPDVTPFYCQPDERLLCLLPEKPKFSLAEWVETEEGKKAIQHEFNSPATPPQILSKT